MLHRFLILILIITCVTPLSAQESMWDNSNVMVNYHYGFNLPEYQFISYLTEKPIQSVDLSFFKATRGKNEWEQIYKYPEFGASLFYSTLGNDDVFGRELALTYFFKVYHNTVDKKLRLYNRIGIGLSYVTKKFEFGENFMNVAVGSNVNIHFNLRTGLNCKLNKHFNLNTGISFDHFSNANTSEPNLGINYVSPYVGLAYKLGKETDITPLELKEHEPKNIFLLYGSIGSKHTRALESSYFLTSSMSLEIQRSLSRAFHFGVGADVFYDTSIKSQVDDISDYKKSDDFQTGVHISQTIVYNNFFFGLQEGVYVGLTNKAIKKAIYSRGILGFSFNDSFWIRIAMKSHLHILDYPELGFGIKIK